MRYYKLWPLLTPEFSTSFLLAFLHSVYCSISPRVWCYPCYISCSFAAAQTLSAKLALHLLGGGCRSCVCLPTLPDWCGMVWNRHEERMWGWKRLWRLCSTWGSWGLDRGCCWKECGGCWGLWLQHSSDGAPQALLEWDKLRSRYRVGDNHHCANGRHIYAFINRHTHRHTHTHTHPDWYINYNPHTPTDAPFIQIH